MDWNNREVMTDWMTVRVELVSGRGIDFDPPPGRVFVVGPNNTFGDLAKAIDLHFARWDLSHLHVFRLEDGRQIGYPDPEWPRLARPRKRDGVFGSLQGRRV